jgi:hypothetical protein
MGKEWSDWQIGYVLIGIFLCLLVTSLLLTPNTRKFNRHFRVLSFDQRKAPDLSDIGEQLKAAGSFKKQRVLSPSEFRIFAIVEHELASLGSGHRVFAQTSLGEILK